MKKSNEQPLKEVLHQMIDAYRLRPKLHQTKIRTLWGQVMGAGIDRYTTNIRLQGRVLFISIASAPLRQELSYGKEKIRKILNEELGEAYIEEVVIR
jgi:hypothetical protein